MTYLENHDQVANSALGRSPSRPDQPRALSSMTALGFWPRRLPCYFRDKSWAQASRSSISAITATTWPTSSARVAVRSLPGFRSTTHPALRDFLPDPSSPESFEISKLDEPENYADLPAYALIQDLLKLRREDEIFREQTSQRLHGAVLGPESFVLRYFSKSLDCRLILINLGRDLYPTPNSEPLLAPPPGMRLEIALVQRAPSLRRVGHPAARGRPALAPVRSLRGCPGSRAR